MQTGFKTCLHNCDIQLFYMELAFQTEKKMFSLIIWLGLYSSH